MNVEAVAVPIMGMMIPIVIVPSALIAKHFSRKRELEHAERMRAIECGYPLHDGSAFSGWAWIVALALGGGVPTSAFQFALASSHSIARESAYLTATVVGLAGIIAGFKLATRLIASNAPAMPQPASTSFVNHKPSMDPDAYDVAGRRG